MHTYIGMFYENIFFILILVFFKLGTEQNQFQLRRVSMDSVEQNTEQLLTITRMPFGHFLFYGAGLSDLCT